jgi:hypothetical protein
MEQEAVVPQDEQESAQTVKSESVDLNIQDLVGLKSIVDVATQRGAFKAAELEAVGKLYNRLSGFIDSVSKQKGQ